MAYSIKTTGAASFKSIDMRCPECQYTEERSIDLRGIEEEADRDIAMNPEVKCPNCEEADLQKVWLRAPSIGNYTNNRAAKTLDARQASMRAQQRKTDDDVRHKHGQNYNDSLSSSVAQRIKKKLVKK